MLEREKERQKERKNERGQTSGKECETIEKENRELETKSCLEREGEILMKINWKRKEGVEQVERGRAKVERRFCR